MSSLSKLTPSPIQKIMAKVDKEQFIFDYLNLNFISRKGHFLD